MPNVVAGNLLTLFDVCLGLGVCVAAGVLIFVFLQRRKSLQRVFYEVCPCFFDYVYAMAEYESASANRSCCCSLTCMCSSIIAYRKIAKNELDTEKDENKIITCINNTWALCVIWLGFVLIIFAGFWLPMDVAFKNYAPEIVMNNVVFTYFIVLLVSCFALLPCTYVCVLTRNPHYAILAERALQYHKPAAAMEEEEMQLHPKLLVVTSNDEQAAVPVIQEQQQQQAVTATIEAEQATAITSTSLSQIIARTKQERHGKHYCTCTCCLHIAHGLCRQISRGIVCSAITTGILFAIVYALYYGAGLGNVEIPLSVVTSASTATSKQAALQALLSNNKNATRYETYYSFDSNVQNIMFAISTLAGWFILIVFGGCGMSILHCC